MKKCNKCKIFKDLDEFTKDKDTKDELRRMCRECEKIRSKKWREENKNYGKEWYKDNPGKHKRLIRIWNENNREKRTLKAREWRNQNTDKVKINYKKYKLKNLYKVSAREKVKWAIRSGKLKKRPCQYPNCKYTEKRIDAHHWDYSKPLEVVWLCSRHHALADKVYKLIIKYGNSHANQR